MNILLEQFEQWLAKQVPPYSEHTCLNYGLIISAFLAYADAFRIHELSHLTPEQLTRFTHQNRQGTSYAPAYIKKRLATLNLFFNWGYTHHVFSANPVMAYKRGRLKPKLLKEVTVVEPTNSKNFFQEEHLELLLDEKRRVERTSHAQLAECVIHLVLSTALRPETLTRLYPEHVNLEQNQIICQASDQTTFIITPVDRIWQKSYRAWLTSRQERVKSSPHLERPLFLSKYGKPIIQQTLHTLIVNYLRSREIYRPGYNLESLRQTALVRFFKQGHSIEQVQALTGLQVLPLEKYRQYADAQKINESLLNKAE